MPDYNGSFYADMPTLLEEYQRLLKEYGNLSDKLKKAEYNPKGIYSATEKYKLHDVVLYTDDYAYLHISDTETIGVAPTDTTVWIKFLKAVKGQDGADGTNGIDGTNGTNGVNGISPTIGSNGNWFIGTTDTGVHAKGDSGITPHIGANGNWYLGSNDTGVHAKGDTGTSSFTLDFRTLNQSLNFDLEPNVYKQIRVTENVSQISFRLGQYLLPDVVNEFVGEIDCWRGDVGSIVWPTNVTWAGTPPLNMTVGQKIQFSIIDYVGMFVLVGGD